MFSLEETWRETREKEKGRQSCKSNFVLHTEVIVLIMFKTKLLSQACIIVPCQRFTFEVNMRSCCTLLMTKAHVFEPCNIVPPLSFKLLAFWGEILIGPLKKSVQKSKHFKSQVLHMQIQIWSLKQVLYKRKYYTNERNLLKIETVLSATLRHKNSTVQQHTIQLNLLKYIYCD